MNKKLLFGLVAFMLITILVSACKIVDANAIPHNPAVQMGSNNFLKNEVTLKKGQGLDLVDTVASRHVIVNGYWDANNNQHPATEPGAPTVSVTVNSSGDTASIGPFNTAGTFRIYCNVHPGMNLTITVQ